MKETLTPEEFAQEQEELKKKFWAHLKDVRVIQAPGKTWPVKDPFSWKEHFDLEIYDTGKGIGCFLVRTIIPAVG